MAEEVSKQKAEMDQQLLDCREKLESMGPSRDTSAGQRECLVKLASKFERIVRDAVDGRYEGNPIFAEKPGLKLATEIMGLNEGFSDIMSTFGRTYEYVATSNEMPAIYEDEPKVERAINYVQKVKDLLSSLSVTPELQQIVRGNFVFPARSLTPVIYRMRGIYKESLEAGFETSEGSLLATLFRDQTVKWQTMVTAHVETIVIIVHRFIKALMEEVFVEKKMREELWDTVLVDMIRLAYRRAMEQTDFLPEIERYGRLSTDDCAFNGILQNAIVTRLVPPLRKFEMYDILESYYEISCQRLVDIVCRRVVEYLLLDGKNSPLRVLTAELITTMGDWQLSMNAGEDALTRQERKRLESEIQRLEIAKQVLGG